MFASSHQEPKSRIIHAKPILHVGVPFKPQTTHKTTEIQPFSFEQRDRDTQARKEAKIQEIYQEEEKVTKPSYSTSIKIKLQSNLL